jgi:hypothetical protein
LLVCLGQGDAQGLVGGGLESDVLTGEHLRTPKTLAENSVTVTSRQADRQISRQQTADSTDSRQQTADSRQQTADSRQQTADSRQQTADLP